MQDQTTQLDPTAKLLAHAIALAENGGAINYNGPAGKAGEQGAYQYMPDTWKKYAGDVLGDPNAPMTPTNQNKVAYTKIKGWLDNGYKPAQIASMWNAGPGEPNAWKGSFSNGNPSTVKNPDGTTKFDVPTYVKNVQRYGQGLAGQQQNSSGQTTALGGATGAVETAVTGSTPMSDNSIGGKLKGEMNYALGTSQSPTGISGAIQGGKEILSGDVLKGAADIGLGVADVAGAAGGAIGDVIGAGVGKLIDWFVPQSIKDWGSQTIQNVFKDPDVQKVLVGLNDMKNNNPELARGLGDAFNIFTSLIPAVKTTQASISLAKSLFNAGIAGEVAKTDVGNAIMQEAKAKGLDPFKSISEAVDSSGLNKTLGVSRQGKQFAASALEKPLQTALNSSIDDVGNALEKSGATVPMQQVTDQAIANVTKDLGAGSTKLSSTIKSIEDTLFQVEQSTVQSGVPAIGGDILKQGVKMSDLYDLIRNPNTDPYIKQAIEDTISTVAKQQGLTEVIAGQSKVAETQLAQRLLEVLKTVKPSNVSRGLLRQGVKAVGATGGGFAGNALFPGVGGAVGGAYGGGWLTGQAEKLAPSVFSNLPAGTISKSILNSAGSTAATLIGNAGLLGGVGLINQPSKKKK